MIEDVRFVYFDLDDTLLDHRRAERDALADVAKTIWQSQTDGYTARVQDAYAEHNRELWHAYADGEITRDQLRELRFTHLIDRFSISGMSWRDLDVLYMKRYAQHWREVSGARAAFELLASQMPVGVITNGFADVQHAKLSRFPFIRDLSSAIVISEEVGFMKPDRRLFARAEAMAGVPGDQILYVGDSYRSDVLGAVQAGWTAAWYSDAPEVDLPERAFAFEEWSRFTDRFSTDESRLP